MHTFQTSQPQARILAATAAEVLLAQAFCDLRDYLRTSPVRGKGTREQRALRHLASLGHDEETLDKLRALIGMVRALMRL